MVRHKRRLQKPHRILLCILVGLLLINASILTARLLQRRFRGPEAEGVTVPEYVTEAFLPENRWSRPGHALTEINGVVIHYVGNPNTSAAANRNYFASLADGRENTFASSHFIVGLEGEILQCIPLTEIAYASKERNSDTVAIEVCHPDEDGEFSAASYASAVGLTAWLCRTFDIDPETEVIRHYDVTGKECPRYYVAHPDAWVRFLQDVALQMNTSADPA
jgi:N-acetylmuramoyl-L-alanine amidase